jgi:HPt (histidine-containing phosphotransfer) domain-containing protein
MAAPVPFLMDDALADLSFEFVDSADAAVEQAMSVDYQMVLLDLTLGGIGAVAAADILRRAGAPCALVAIGEFAPGDLSGAGFDHCLAPPLSGEAIRALIGTMPSPPSLVGDMGEDWIARECADLVAEFRAGLPATAMALRAALDGRDMVALKSLVHALKGSAGAYGFAAVTQQCAKIESDIRAGHVDVASACAASLVDDLERGANDLQAHG